MSLCLCFALLLVQVYVCQIKLKKISDRATMLNKKTNQLANKESYWRNGTSWMRNFIYLHKTYFTAEWRNFYN